MNGLAIGYTRVSTGAQASSGLGIAAQEKAIRRFCEFKGLELIYTYEDPGYSGGLLLKNRPSGEALWKRLEEHEGEAWELHLVASKLDRLWRNVGYMHVELAELEKLTVNVHTAGNGRTLVCGGEDADPEARAFSRLWTQFTATVDELERIRAKERTAEAMEAKRARGEHLGAIPFGFEIRGDSGMLYPLEAEMATLGMIWHFKDAREHTHRECALELNRRRRKPKRSKSWTRESVQKQFKRLTDDPELREQAKVAFIRYLERQAKQLGV